MKLLRRNKEIWDPTLALGYGAMGTMACVKCDSDVAQNIAFEGRMIKNKWLFAILPLQHTDPVHCFGVYRYVWLMMLLQSSLWRKVSSNRGGK